MSQNIYQLKYDHINHIYDHGPGEYILKSIL